MNKTKTAKNLIFALIAVVIFAVAGMGYVHADCEPVYGGGENCTYNKRFQIDKDVRLAGESEWQEDKITGVHKYDVIEFRIKIKNKSDDGTGHFDNMEMEDFLPDELEKVGGVGLTEEWEDFKHGDTKEFVIQAKIKEDEFNRTDNFEKCVVNKAEVRWDGDFESSDTATVCYGNGEPTELPKTGAGSDLALIGLGLVASGLLIKVTRKFAKTK